MPKWGGMWSSSWGGVENHLSHLIADYITPGVLRVRSFPRGKSRAKFYAPFINGVYTGENIKAPLTGVIEGVFTLTPGTTVGSIYLEDAGEWASFSEYIPSGWAEYFETLTANRLQYRWHGTYSLTSVDGDDQLTVTSITGAKRGINVAAVPNFKTRGKLTYSINRIDDDVILRWWADDALVMEGTAALVYAPDGGNLLASESAFDTGADWNPLEASVTADATVDPDGGMLADLITESIANDNHLIRQVSIATITGEKYKLEVDAKMNGRRYLQVLFDNTRYAMFDLQTGVVTEEVGVTGEILAAANGFYLCSITGTAVASLTDVQFFLSDVPTGLAPLYTGDGVSGVYLYKAELFHLIASAASIPCSEMNGSGLLFSGSITYTADIAPNIAFIEMRWNKEFQIHYSTSALAFPRAAQYTVQDTGSDDYIYLVSPVAAGTYNVAIVAVDDEGVEQTAAIPSDSKTVNIAPSPPTITSITGTAAALTVNWTNGEAGCTCTVYASLINEGVNFGAYALPAPIATALNATSQVLAAVSGYASTSKQTAIDTLFAAFDAAVAACNADFNQTDFPDAFTTFITALKAAIDTYGDSISLRLTDFKTQLSMMADNLAAFESTLPTLSTDDYANVVGKVYGLFLSYVGSMLDQSPGRYTLPNGAIGNAANGSEAIGTGSNDDGTAGEISSAFQQSLKEVAEPITVVGKIRVIVRATKAAVQETRDLAYEVEFDNAGNIVSSRPNEAMIQTISLDGLEVTVSGAVFNDDEAATPTHLDLYVVAAARPVGSTINTASPQASTTLSISRSNYQSASVAYTVAAPGWYDVAVLARVGTSRSAIFKTETVYLDTTPPGAVSDFEVKVIRGRGAISG